MNQIKANGHNTRNAIRSELLNWLSVPFKIISKVKVNNNPQSK